MFKTVNLDSSVYISGVGYLDFTNIDYISSEYRIFSYYEEAMINKCDIKYKDGKTSTITIERDSMNNFFEEQVVSGTCEKRI